MESKASQSHSNQRMVETDKQNEVAKSKAPFSSPQDVGVGMVGATAAVTPIFSSVSQDAAETTAMVPIFSSKDGAAAAVMPTPSTSTSKWSPSIQNTTNLGKKYTEESIIKSIVKVIMESLSLLIFLLSKLFSFLEKKPTNWVKKKD